MTKRRPKRVSQAVIKDTNQRMNFLYQAAHTVLSVNPENVGLARFYAHTMKTISRKLLIKLDPSIKRTVCKHCNALLVPGITSTVRVKNKRETHVVITCLDCGTLKRFNARKNFELWSEKEENKILSADSPSDHSMLNEKQEISNQSSKNGEAFDDKKVLECGKG